MKNDIDIRPLCPCDDLNNSSYKVYDSFLDKIINDNRINNIAITGNFGIGKSSVLRTFSKNRKLSFLYISLSDFDMNHYERDDGENTCQNNKQLLEYSLLRQIISVCHKNNIPQSEYKMVKEKSSIRNKYVFSFSIAVYCLMIFMLVFSTYVSEFLHLIFNAKFSQVSFHFEHMLLYIIVGIMTSFFAGFFIYQLLMHAKIKEISAKLTHSSGEVGTTAIIEESVLEANNFELVYMIESLSRNYKAIVFEDMDRLSPKICIEIFSQLRSINFAVNERNPKLHSKFIYVVNDNIMFNMNQTKFFDYILTIIPELSYISIESNVNSLLNEIEIVDKKEIFIKAFRDYSYLHDYRMINHIYNEYCIFRCIEEAKYKDTEIPPSINNSSLLAFVIYKVVLSDDYYLIKTGKSSIFPIYVESSVYEKSKSDDRYKLMEFFINNDLLNSNCMKFLGYTCDEQVQLYKDILLSEKIDYKREIINKDNDKICAVLFKNETIDKVLFIKGIEDLFFKKYFLSNTLEDFYIEIFFECLKHRNDSKYTTVEIQICNDFANFDLKERIWILQYFIALNFQDFIWLETKINDDDKNIRKKCFEAIDKLNPNEMNFIMSMIYSTILKNIEGAKEFPKIIVEIEKMEKKN